MTASVVKTSPLIATFEVDDPDCAAWTMPGFSGVAALVDALAKSQSPEFVSLEGLMAQEEAARAVAPVEVVNPRGQAPDRRGECVDIDDDLPTMDRFEVVFKPSWAADLANASPAFRRLSTRMVQVARGLAAPHDASALKEYWRLLVGFPGTAAQKWYADDVDSERLLTCEVPLSGSGEGYVRFPLGEDGESVDLEGRCASEFETGACVVYSGNAIHYYTAVEGDAPRVALQVILSADGDPNDCVPSDVEGDTDLGDDDDLDSIGDGASE